MNEIGSVTRAMQADKGPQEWQPTTRDGEGVEDVPLVRWIREALGAASMCWIPRPAGVFDSTAVGDISRAVEARVERALREAWQRGHAAAKEEQHNGD